MGDETKSSCFVDEVMHDKVREFMIATVSERNSVKSTELVTSTTIALVDRESSSYIEGNKDLKPECQLGEALNQVMDELIQQGELIELEYCTPLFDCRLRSLLFPKGTTFTKN